MHLDSHFQLQLGRSPQRFAQYLLLDFQLMMIAGMLILTSAARTEIRAGRLHAVGRGRNDRASLGPRETRLLLRDRSVDCLTPQYKGHEDGFSRASRIGGQPRQSVAAVDQFFDGEKQAPILPDPYYKPRPAAAPEAHAH